MTSSPRTPGSRLAIAVLPAVAASLVPFLAMVAAWSGEAREELSLGWLLAVSSGTLHRHIAMRSVGATAAAFLRWGIVINTLRIAAVLATLLLVSFFTDLRLLPFALSLVAGTLVMLGFNSVSLLRDNAWVSRSDA